MCKMYVAMLCNVTQSLHTYCLCTLLASACHIHASISCMHVHLLEMCSYMYLACPNRSVGYTEIVLGTNYYYWQIVSHEENDLAVTYRCKLKLLGLLL